MDYTRHRRPETEHMLGLLEDESIQNLLDDSRLLDVTMSKRKRGGLLKLMTLYLEQDSNSDLNEDNFVVSGDDCQEIEEHTVETLEDESMPKLLDDSRLLGVTMSKRKRGNIRNCLIHHLEKDSNTCVINEEKTVSEVAGCKKHSKVADCKKHEPTDCYLYSETSSISEDEKPHQEKICYSVETLSCSISKLDLDDFENDANMSLSSIAHAAAIHRPLCEKDRKHTVSAQTA